MRMDISCAKSRTAQRAKRDGSDDDPATAAPDARQRIQARGPASSPRACWQSARGQNGRALKRLVEMAVCCVEALADIGISASTFSCQLNHFVPNPGSRDECQHALGAVDSWD